MALEVLVLEAPYSTDLHRGSRSTGLCEEVLRYGGDWLYSHPSERANLDWHQLLSFFLLPAFPESVPAPKNTLLLPQTYS